MVTETPRTEFVHKRACEFILSSGITSLPVNPIEAIKKHNWGLVSYSQLSIEKGKDLSLYFPSRDGFTVASENGYCIAYNDKRRSVCRINFTLMHEAGHIFLGHFKNGTTICNKEKYDVFEKEANLFASEVLAPRAVILSCPVSSPEILKAACGISHDAAVIAFDNLRSSKPLEIDRKIEDSFRTYITIHQRRNCLNNTDI